VRGCWQLLGWVWCWCRGCSPFRLGLDVVVLVRSDSPSLLAAVSFLRFFLPHFGSSSLALIYVHKKQVRSCLVLRFVVVVEVGAVFMGFGAVVPRVSIVAADFAHEVRFHGWGIVFSMLLEFGPFAEMFSRRSSLATIISISLTVCVPFVRGWSRSSLHS